MDTRMEKQRNPFGIFGLLLTNIVGLFNSFIKMILDLHVPKFGFGDGNTVSKKKGIKDIPGPFPLPYFGTILTSTSLKNKDYIQANEERVKKYGTLVKEEFYGNFPMIKVLDPDHTDKLLKLSLTTRPPMEIIEYYRKSRPDRYDSVGIVSSNGAEYAYLHRKFAHLVMNPGTSGLDQMAQDFIALLKSSPTKVFSDFAPVLNVYVAESSFYNAFGNRVGLLDNRPGSEKLKNFIEVHDLYWLIIKDSWKDNWKYYATPLWKNLVAAEDELLDCVEDLMQSAIKNDQASGLLALMLKDSETTYKTKRVILLETILGATEPVLSSILMCLWCITKYENVSEKLYAELRDALPKKDSPIDNEVLDRLPYLRACILEAIRICPSAATSLRIIEQPVQLGEYELPKYSLVELQLWYLCLQDSSFYKAKEFIPERWIYDENNKPPFKPHRPILSSGFGIGNRKCIGRRFATESIKTILAKIFRYFEVKFEKGMKTECEWLNIPERPVEVTLIERSD